jgi:hypothetical protein
MKLSEAIRLGSLLRPQGFRALVDPYGGSCALGAAMEATGHPTKAPREIEPWDVFPLLTSGLLFRCPRCHHTNELQGMCGIILCLNDTHKWTRERIADWVATIEPEESPSVVVEETLEALKV